jgi:DNA-binding FadR family transcriptional regulator
LGNSNNTSNSHATLMTTNMLGANNALLAASQSRRAAQTALAASKDEDERAIRAALERCTTAPESCGPESIPLFLALAQAARPHTLARTTAQCDARIAYLVGQLQERLPRAMEAKKTIAAIQHVAKGQTP